MTESSDNHPINRRNHPIPTCTLARTESSENHPRAQRNHPTGLMEVK